MNDRHSWTRDDYLALTERAYPEASLAAYIRLAGSVGLGGLLAPSGRLEKAIAIASAMHTVALVGFPFAGMSAHVKALEAQMVERGGTADIVLVLSADALADSAEASIRQEIQIVENATRKGISGLAIDVSHLGSADHRSIRSLAAARDRVVLFATGKISAASFESEVRQVRSALPDISLIAVCASPEDADPTRLVDAGATAVAVTPSYISQPAGSHGK